VVGASASSFTESCSGGAGFNTTSGTATCNAFTIPGGNNFTAVLVTLTNGFTGGVINPTSLFTYVWTPGGANGGLFAVQTDSAANTSVSVNASIFSGSPVSETSNSSSVIINPSSLPGGLTFLSFTETFAVTGGTLASNGTQFLDVTAEFDYSSGIPEPATLSLVGAGLLALGVAAKKRGFKKS
jgi:hypothetical protein